MAHIVVMCPNIPGLLNPTIALADALRSRGHRLTFFLLGDPSAPVLAAGFEVIEMGVPSFRRTTTVIRTLASSETPAHRLGVFAFEHSAAGENAQRSSLPGQLQRARTLRTAGGDSRDRGILHALPQDRGGDDEAAALKARHTWPLYSPALTLAANRSSTPFTYL
jgi:hypothetical protein